MNRIHLIISIIVIILGSIVTIIAQDTEEDKIQPKDIGFTMEITVSFVKVTVSVTDRHGRTVHGLERDDFNILENEVSQKIVDCTNARGLPKRILVLLDVSGSMRIRNKIGLAKKAIEALVNNLQKEDEISLLFFTDGDVDRAVKYTTDHGKILQALWEEPAYGKTALRDAVEQTPLYALAEGNYQRALLLVSDGIDNSSKVTLKEAVRSARQVDLPIYSVELNPFAGSLTTLDKNQKDIVNALKILSNETGGRYSKVKNSAETLSALNQMMKDLENQYLIVFKSSFSNDSGKHKIEVETSKFKQYQVRARRGYFVDK